ncbi:MAG: transposase [Planctomycetota bacterium]|nr:transposase [Planctomycetota bacterium]
MILSPDAVKYFKLLSSKVTSAMASYQCATPYFIETDPVIKHYEVLRKVWVGSVPIKQACIEHELPRSSYYEIEDRFVLHGLAGLFSYPGGTVTQAPNLEQLVLIVKNCRPTASQLAVLRVAQAVPVTQAVADSKVISRILNSHGYGYSRLETDRDFFGRIQRSLEELNGAGGKQVEGRRRDKRRQTFFVDADPYHNRMELLRELFFNSKAKVYDSCIRLNVPVTTYYRLAKEYRLYGPWAIISANAYGKKDSISDELQLKILLERLEHPSWSAQHIVDTGKLRCSRYVVNRITKRWGLQDKGRAPVALDRFMELSKPKTEEPFRPIETAYDLLPEEIILNTRRINRHFELICKKMKTHAYHICDPGPLLLAPFVNDLGIVQSFETYGPPKLRGKEIANLAMLNVFRILGGYRRISHLSNSKDRSVALAGGIGLFGSSSRFYEDSCEFKFDQLHKMRCDLVARAKQLGIIEGLKLGFDFHFKDFYGKNAYEDGIGKGPNKKGDLVPGFRPHVAWDLAANVIVSIAYYQGAVRSTKIIRQFCEQNIYPILDPLAIEEIYMDSEYTKEADFHYFKETVFKNGEIYVCLKQNPQIKKLIVPALQEENWPVLPNNNEDEYKTLKVQLPRTKLPLMIAILRDRKTKKNIRCFATTNTELGARELLKKYRYRWIIENGLKDLVGSYYIDEVYGKDPEKIEFEFYCVLVARMAYEYFLKELGSRYLHKEDGNKYTLNSMRNLLFEKRNCTIEQNSEGDIVVTILDTEMTELIQAVSNMLDTLKEKGKNKVLWWNNRSVLLRTANQYPAKVSGQPFVDVST